MAVTETQKLLASIGLREILQDWGTDAVPGADSVTDHKEVQTPAFGLTLGEGDDELEQHHSIVDDDMPRVCWKMTINAYWIRDQIIITWQNVVAAPSFQIFSLLFLRFVQKFWLLCCAAFFTVIITGTIWGGRIILRMTLYKSWYWLSAKLVNL